MKRFPKSSPVLPAVQPHPGGVSHAGGGGYDEIGHATFGRVASNTLPTKPRF